MTLPDAMIAVHRPWWQTWWCVALVLVLSAVPLLWWPVPPLTDVPARIARYRVMLDSDPAPNIWGGVDLLVAALAPLIGLGPAVKAIAVAIPVLTAAAMLWLSREAHGRVQPSAYFALPFAYNVAFLQGSLDYTLAVALALGAFALWLRLARQWRVRAGVFVPISALIWAVHPFGWLSLGVMILSAEVARQRAVEDEGARRGWRESGWRAAVYCLPLAPPALMLLGWRPDSAGGWLASLALKPGWLASALSDRWQPFDFACMAVVMLVIYRSYRDHRFVHAPMLAAAALGLLVLFVAMPFAPPFADSGFASYATVLALLSIRFNARVKQRRRAEVAWAALAFLLVRTAAGTASFAIESRDWSHHLAALDHMPGEARVAAFVGSTCAQPLTARTGQLPRMAAARRAAPSGDRFAPGVFSQIVLDAPCPASPEFRTLDQALAELPRDRFDLIWLVTPGRISPALLGETRLVWSDGRDFLFEIPHPPIGRLERSCVRRPDAGRGGTHIRQARRLSGPDDGR